MRRRAERREAGHQILRQMDERALIPNSVTHLGHRKHSSTVHRVLPCNPDPAPRENARPVPNRTFSKTASSRQARRTTRRLFETAAARGTAAGRSRARFAEQTEFRRLAPPLSILRISFRVDWSSDGRPPCTTKQRLCSTQHNGNRTKHAWNISRTSSSYLCRTSPSGRRTAPSSSFRGCPGSSGRSSDAGPCRPAT